MFTSTLRLLSGSSRGGLSFMDTRNKVIHVQITHEHKINIINITCHLANAFIQSDLHSCFIHTP